MERLGQMDVVQRDNRYNRQIILSNIGEEGQTKLNRAKVLVVGAGGLGSPLLQYIAAAGVGVIGIIDNDTVAEHNLQRQVLYNNHQIGKSKAKCAKEFIERLNPHCQVIAYNTRFTDDNAHGIAENYDIIADCTDNLASRYLIDRITKETGKPFIHGSLCEYEGRVALFNYHGSSSYADIFPFEPETIDSFTQPNGIIGAFAGIVGSLQALEVIKVINGNPSLIDKMMLIDGLSLDMKTIRLR